MTLEKAMDVIGITSVSPNEENEIKKRFKELMRRYHPDINHDKDTTDKAQLIGEAFYVIKTTIKKMKKLGVKQGITASPVKLAVISISDLIDLYNGKTIVTGGCNIQRSNMSQFNLFISIEFSIGHNGIYRDYNELCKWNMSDDYDVYCTIHTTDISKPDDVNIKIYGKDTNFSIKSQSIKISFTFEKDIVIKLGINRQLVE